MRSVAVIATALVLAGTVAGCATKPDPSPGSLIGMSVTAAAEQVPTGRSFAWYDLTRDILDKDGTLIGGDNADGEGGVIIAVCASATTIGSSSKISAGAIPESDYHGAIKREAQAGGFQHLLPECQHE